MTTDGKAAEIAANEWLIQQGRAPIGTNLWYPEGEIDWLGWDRNVLTIVEIKATSMDWEIAAQRIDRKKIERLNRLANRLRIEHPEWNDNELRLEALLVRRTNTKQPWNFHLLQIGNYDE